MEEKKKAYSKFWDTLLPAYPISKGSIRLPIASELQTIEGLNIKELQTNLIKILEEILEKYGNKDAAIKNALEAKDDSLLPLINNDFTGVVRFDCLWNPNTKKHLS